MTTKRSQGTPKTVGMDSVRAMMRGLGEIMDRLGQLAEGGGEVSGGSKDSKSSQGSADKGINGVYGFSIKIGGGGDGVRIQPFGNLRKDKKTGEAAVHEVREPATDVFEETDGIRVVAELPGVSAADVHIEVAEDVLTLSAAAGDKRYRKEILLARPFTRDQATVTCNNGVVEIWFKDRGK